MKAALLLCVGVVLLEAVGALRADSSLGLAAEAKEDVFHCGTIPPPPSQSKAKVQLSLPSALGEKRLLLYRVDFSDAVGAAISSNAAVDLANQLNSYYREMSYGKMGFAPVGTGSVVTTTLRLPQPSTAYDNNFVKLIDDTRAVAASAGYSPGAYDFDILFTGAKPFLVFGALAYVGGPGLWIGNNNFNVAVAGHELGHNLGLPHASSWNTGDTSAVGPGTRSEYGDLFDSMGVPAGSTSHFNTRFKHFLGWLSEEAAPIASTNGIYRITAHDSALAQGIRALRIPKNQGLNYWLEFRQFFTGNRWITNGLSFRWGGNGSENTLLLDITSGTPSGFQDSPLWLGRTFSDICLDTHVTVLGKAGTNPEALDVAVYHGPFPENLAPTVSITPSATATVVGSPVNLAASAHDANGDAVAYFWDFGDGNFGTNQSVVSYAWARDGEYVARCTVSDMKGGTASASVIVRVGPISTFLVEGRILYQGLPVEGALVKTTGRFAYSDSDGYYRLTRLAAGRFTISAQKDGLSLFNDGFENPVAVGPSASNNNFRALPFDMNSYTLIQTGSVWRYLDTGVDPGAGWQEKSFDDSQWKSGPGRFGYGVGNEGTVVSYGTDATSKHLTTWFRKEIVVGDPSLFPHLLFRLRRDDGAAVYVNGQEVFRENLPGGTLSPTTIALTDVTASEEAFYFPRLVWFPGLTPGTNIIAVEIHQSGANSPDLSFDLEITGLNADPNTLRPALAVQTVHTNVMVQWPGVFPGWNLQRSAVLGSSNAWSTLNVPSVTSNGLRQVSVPTTNALLFLRLAKPTYCAPVLP